MRVKVLALVVTLISSSVSAYAIPTQGEAATVGGQVRLQQAGGDTYLYFRGEDVIGVVPFGYKSTFPGLDRIDGRDAEITGVVDGQQMITLRTRTK